MKTARILIALAALVFLSGCKTPDVNFKSALLKGLTTSRMNVGLNLELINPNDFTIPVKAVDYKLDLWNSPFTNGTSQFKKQVGARSRTDVEVPLGIRYSAVQVGVTNLISKRTIPWGLEGGCTFNVSGNPIRVGFGHQGKWANPLRK